MSARRGEHLIRHWAIVAVIVALGSCGCGGGNPVQPGPPGPPPGSIPESEPNDATPNIIGTLDATDKLIYGTAAGRNDVDLFSVTLAATGSLYMSLSWSGTQDLEVGVTDQNGTVVHNQDAPAANPEQCTVTGRAPGTYHVRVGSRSSSSVTYLLTIGRR